MRAGGLVLLRHNTAEHRRLVAYFISAATTVEQPGGGRPGWAASQSLFVKTRTSIKPMWLVEGCAQYGRSETE